MAIHEPIPTFDLYAELGIDPTASQATIETAYRSQAKRRHPDTTADPAGSTARMKRLNLARAWLTDPLSRSRYDRARATRGASILAAADAGTATGAGPAGADGPLDRPGPRHADAGSRFGGISPAPVALVALLVVLLTLAAGIGSSPLTVAGFAAGVVVMTFYGLLAILGAILPPRR